MAVISRPWCRITLFEMADISGYSESMGCPGGRTQNEVAIPDPDISPISPRATEEGKDQLTTTRDMLFYMEQRDNLFSDPDVHYWDWEQKHGSLAKKCLDDILDGSPTRWTVHRTPGCDIYFCVPTPLGCAIRWAMEILEARDRWQISTSRYLVKVGWILERTATEWIFRQSI